MVTIYSKNDCVQCKMTKRFLDTNNVEYREINLMSNQNTSTMLKASVSMQLLLFKRQLKHFLVSSLVNLKNYHNLTSI